MRDPGQTAHLNVLTRKVRTFTPPSETFYNYKMTRATCTAQNLVQEQLRSLARLHSSAPRIVLRPGMRQSLWQGQKEPDAEGSQRSPGVQPDCLEGRTAHWACDPFVSRALEQSCFKILAQPYFKTLAQQCHREGHFACLGLEQQRWKSAPFWPGLEGTHWD